MRNRGKLDLNPTGIYRSHCESDAKKKLMKNFKSESKEIKKQQQQQNSGYSRKSTQLEGKKPGYPETSKESILSWLLNKQ